ncbi:two-component system sensor histidine kinase NtrB [Halorhodospira abdelmalekii]|uniref:two-component system sensor histidine kinase NtrB n=1 Tax=Halorhodospira abdelmalekii TaxID=421629 RepID=UPI0019044315|nr:ATP-binding protein [Halorhodospira abdelmalekii]
MTRVTWRYPRSLAVRLSVTFLLLTLAVAVPVTLTFDHFARSIITDRVEAVEDSYRHGVIDSEELAEGFFAIRVAALVTVALTSLLAAVFGAWAAFRWRASLQHILRRGRDQASRVQPLAPPPEQCARASTLEGPADELDEIEDQLIHTLERLSRSQWLLDSVDDIVVLADTDGTIRHGNAAMGASCACCPVPKCSSTHIATIIGQPLWLRIHNGLAQNRSGGTLEDEVTINGRTFPALISYRLQDGQVVIKLTDLTEYRQLKEHVAKLQALSTLGEMSTELAHEIKNNILPVKLLCELAPIAADDRTAILRSLDHIHNLVNDFMDFGAGTSSSSQVSALDKALAGWTELLHTNAKSNGVELTLDAPSTLVNIPSGLRVVYANLVRNAIQAAAATPHGRVAIVAEVDEHGTLVLEITDNGAGIPESFRAQMFQPFATTRAEGTGLGLALVERYVHQAGGYIRCHSEANRGTTFAIFWPQAGTGTAVEHAERPDAMRTQ